MRAALLTTGLMVHKEQVLTPQDFDPIPVLGLAVTIPPFKRITHPHKLGKILFARPDMPVFFTKHEIRSTNYETITQHKSPNGQKA
jgi:hypothetical protein